MPSPTDTVVKFYNAPPGPLAYSVIIPRHGDDWVLVQHKERTTLEFPGGHIEAGEDHFACARRELTEETGAKEFSLEFVCYYGVNGSINGGEERFGALFRADIAAFAPLGNFEIGRVLCQRELPLHWTYPDIQPMLWQRAMEQGQQ